MNLHNYSPPPVLTADQLDWRAVDQALEAARIPRTAPVGIFGSRTIGRTRPDSDLDLVVLGPWESVQVPGVDLVVIDAPEVPREHRLASHLARYLVWRPGHGRALPELLRAPFLPFIHPDVPEFSAEWYVRLYREFLRLALLFRRHAIPPTVILDEMWPDRMTQAQVGHAVTRTMTEWNWKKIDPWTGSRNSWRDRQPLRDLFRIMVEGPVFQCATCATIVTGDDYHSKPRSGPLADQLDDPDRTLDLTPGWKRQRFCSEECFDTWTGEAGLVGTKWYKFPHRRSVYVAWGS